jgi:hypothetical protein
MEIPFPHTLIQNSRRSRFWSCPNNPRCDRDIRQRYPGGTWGRPRARVVRRQKNVELPAFLYCSPPSVCLACLSHVDAVHVTADQVSGVSHSRADESTIWLKTVRSTRFRSRSGLRSRPVNIQRSWLAASQPWSIDVKIVVIRCSHGAWKFETPICFPAVKHGLILKYEAE